MKYVQITAEYSNIHGSCEEGIFNINVSNPTDVIYDDRSIEEMINEGDADPSDFLKYQFGNTFLYTFGNSQKDFQAVNRRRGYRN